MLLLLDPTARLVIAHRGNSMHAPEDTLESLRQGMALGADGLEFDVRLSADGVPVLLHDPTLDRTTDGAGPVADRTLAELRALDAGYRFSRDAGRTYPWRARGIRIPTLDEALETFPDTPCLMELKAPEATDALARCIEAHRARERVLVGSFHDASLAVLRDRGFLVSASQTEIKQLYLRAITLRTAGRPLFHACSVPPQWRRIPVPVRRFARMLQPCGIPTHAWTINDPKLAQRLWDGGVNAILSDDPGTMLKLLGRVPRTLPPVES